MKDDLQALTQAFERKTRDFLVKLLKLDEHIEIAVEGNLIEQIGLDSIEAFDAVATLHELLEVAIPDDFSPKVATSIRGLSTYVMNTFGPEAVERFIALDLDQASVFGSAEEI